MTLYIIRLNRKLISSLAHVADRTKELEQANQKLKYLSNTDELTGIANRRRFNDVLINEFLRAKRSGEPLALLLIDIDYFKQYNDYYGHLAGDDFLIKIVGIICGKANRASDLVARYGGDEFAVVLPNTSQVKAHEFAKEICENIVKQSIPHINSTYTIATTSIGVFSCIPEKEMNVEYYIKSTDIALYSAKDAGRNCAKTLVAS